MHNLTTAITTTTGITITIALSSLYDDPMTPKWAGLLRSQERSQIWT
jgi:hypothetical protein